MRQVTGPDLRRLLRQHVRRLDLWMRSLEAPNIGHDAGDAGGAGAAALLMPCGDELRAVIAWRTREHALPCQADAWRLRLPQSEP